MDRWRILTELANIKKNTTELKNTITEMKNAPEGINSRLDGTEDRVSETEQQKSQKPNRKKNLKVEDILRGLCNISDTAITENFPNLGKQKKFSFRNH